MNKSITIILVLIIFFGGRYYVQKNQEQEQMSYEQIQRDLDNLKNAHKYR